MIPLGRPVIYQDTYDASLLFPIPRREQRMALGITDDLPFYGQDAWTLFELSWLNAKGKPMVAMADVAIPCDSVNLIESKSFKLYLNSFNQTIFEDIPAVETVLKRDLSKAAGCDVNVHLYDESHTLPIVQWRGTLLDNLDVVCEEYQVNSHLLKTNPDHIVSKSCYSHLLKSNCLVTGQPDWGSIQVTYTGPDIDEASLLQYLVSYRKHNEFHEHCVERIFMDIMEKCKPTTLTVYARYTRRGGLDINPIRSTSPIKAIKNQRLFRQ